jgi:hypothetical protein
MKTKRLALGVLVGSVYLASIDIQSTLAASNAYTVSNGIQCRTDQGQYDHFTRDQRGIRNNQTSSRRVYCPFNTPSYDSDRSQNPRLYEAKIYVNNSGAAPTCFIYTASQGGSPLWSSLGTLDYYGGRIIRFNFSRQTGFKSEDGRTASIGYVCDVPANGMIHGATAEFAISSIQGGIP